MSANSLIDVLLNTFDSDEKSSEILKQTKTKPGGDLTINITYARDVGKHFSIQMPTKTAPGKFDMSSQAVMTKVRNGRNLGITYGAAGFQLITHKTTLSTRDFYCNDDDIIKKVYYKEVEERVKQITGAEYVKCYHHVVRCSGSPPKYAKEKPGEPAHAAHNDYSALTAYKTYKWVRPKDGKYKKGRYAVVNVWRNISDTNCIQRDHLALIDARSVNGPDDFLPYDYTAAGITSESYYANAVGAQLNKYKWYYFPNMAKNEMIIFKQFDSDYTAAARYTFHSAIHDPTTTKDTPSRESIESRLVAFFPAHEPNTIPPETKGTDTEQLITTAVAGIFQGISAQSLSYWPTKHYNTMATGIRNKAVETVISEMVRGSAVAGYHGLAEATEEQLEQVIGAITKRKDEFKKIVLKNFVVAEDGRDDEKKNAESDIDVVVKGVNGIFGGLLGAAYWPESARQAMAEQVHSKDIKEVIEYVVKGSADGGYHHLGNATKEQIQQVIEALYERKDEFKEIAVKHFPLK